MFNKRRWSRKGWFMTNLLWPSWNHPCEVKQFAKFLTIQQLTIARLATGKLWWGMWVHRKPPENPGWARTWEWEQQGNWKRKETKGGKGNNRGRQTSGDKFENWWGGPASLIKPRKPQSCPWPSVPKSPKFKVWVGQGTAQNLVPEKGPRT